MTSAKNKIKELLLDELPLDTLKQKSRHLQIINELAIDLLHTSELEPILWLVAKTAIANIGFVDCVIYLFDADRKILVQRAAHGPKNPEKMDILNPITIPLGRGIVGQVAERGRSEIVNDTRLDSRYILDDQMRLSEIAAPILYNDEVIGVIDSEHPDAHFYTDEHLEVLTIIASMAAMSIANAMNRERLEQLSEQLHYDASHDALTGLLNRRAFESELEALIEDRSEDRLPHVLCYADVNGFKKLNDTYGHSAGDEYLRKIADILREHVVGDNLCARIGGDEFSVIFKNSDIATAKAICTAICDRLKSNRARRSSDGEYTHMSMGIHLIEPDATDISEAMACADAACYAAKKSSESNVCEYADIREHVAVEKAEMGLVDWLRSALEQNNLQLHGQEVFSTQSVSGKRMFELLLRPGDDAPYFPSVTELLQAAERHGLATRIDHWVVEHALNWLESLTTETRSQLQWVSINLSIESVCNEAFQKFLVSRLKRAKISGLPICIEITEHVALEDFSSATRFADQLRNIGCLIALDDFGSGLTSYDYLRGINIDILKIDGSFVRKVNERHNESVMLESIIQMARGLGIQSLAEHVESSAALEHVSALGVDLAQGFHMSAPIPLNDLVATLQDTRLTAN
ncbi:MAG: EAL domain-containing protein [Pseudomonadota bacterium]